MIGLCVLVASVAAAVRAEERRPSTLPPLSTAQKPFTGKLTEEDLPPASGPMSPPATALPSPQGYSAPVASPHPALVPPFPAPGVTVPLGGPVPFPPRPAVITNVPPPLPPKDTFTPEERVALHFVEEGEAALGHNDLDRAQERFERAVAVAPFQPYSYYFLARVAFARRAHQQALAFSHKAELLFARSDETWRGETASLKGIIYEDLGDYVHARVAYQRCLQLVPGHLKALTALTRLSESVEDPVASAQEPLQNVSIP